jgi:hypothetical protein
VSLSYVRYVADGTTDEFDVPFDFVNRTHVVVTIDGNPPVLPIRWAGERRIKIADRLALGSTVELRRETPVSSRLVDFQNGSVLTEEELDTAIDQLFFLHQELRDLCSDAVGGGLTRVVDDGAAAIQRIVERVIADETVLEINNALADIANQGAALADLALDQSALDRAFSDSQTLLNTVDTRVSDLRADHDALVSTVDSLLGGDPGTGIATLIQNESSARIAGDTALASTIALIGARSGDNLSFIINTNTVRVSPSETLATRLTTLSATDANNAAAVINERNARIAGDEVLAQEIDLVDTRVGNAEASILTERTARINGDSALTTSLNALTSRVGSAESAIASESTTRANADSALTTQLNTLTARVGTAEAAITNESTARANADGVFAASLALIGARTGDNSAWQLNLNTVRVSPTETLATRLTTLAAADANNAAAIATEQTARTTAISALSQSISTLTTRVNGNEATITTLQQSVNGVAARYGVALNVNGHITGFVQNNDGTTGSFDILADRFRVVVPNVGPRPVFDINGTQITMNGNVAINGSLLVNGTVTTPSMQQNSVSTSAYWQTAFGGAMINFPQNTWVDFSTATGGGSGGGGGGSGGGGGGGFPGVELQ